MDDTFHLVQKSKQHKKVNAEKVSPRALPHPIPFCPCRRWLLRFSVQVIYANTSNQDGVLPPPTPRPRPPQSAACDGWTWTQFLAARGFSFNSLSRPSQLIHLLAVKSVRAPSQ